jgi:hypothetical protein
MATPATLIASRTIPNVFLTLTVLSVLTAPPSKGQIYFRRPRITNRAPETKASALTPELASISGTVPAIAAPDTPITSNAIPIIFLTYKSLLLFSLNGDCLPSRSLAEVDQGG